MNKAVVGVLRRSAAILTIAAAAIAMSSCYPNAPENSEDFDVVATFYDQNADFTSLTSYSMPDSVVQVQISGSENRDISHDHDGDILAEVADQLAARGYQRENNPDQNKPDFVVLVSAAATTEYDPYASDPWYSYWSWWWEGADSLPDVDVSWGLDFSWYSGSVVYSYDVGALLVTLLDVRNVDTANGEDLNVLWMGTINGIITGNDLSVTRRVIEGIQQMFRQSPYLSKTGQGQ
jgi:hypothetical protein